MLFRAPGQLAITPLVGLLESVDAVISLSPIVSPVWRGMSVCFMRDWRHIRRPDEFRAGQRLYRLLWKISARFARMTVCISEKAQNETRSAVPKARTICIPNGRDHARRRKRRRFRPVSEVVVVTFGHHNNKRPELVINAMAKLPPKLPRGWHLDILGATGRYRDSLAHLAAVRGVASKVRLPGFVDDTQYEEILSGADCIVLASSDEGFGLPLADAEYLGVPAVVTSDCGVADLFPDAMQADPSDDSIAQAILACVERGRSDPASKPTWGWSDVVKSLRSHLVVNADDL